MAKAIKHIIVLFTLIKTNKITSRVETSQSKTLEDAQNRYVNIKIEELPFSVRSYNCLKRAKINTVGDILQHTTKTLLELRHFGQKSCDEVVTLLRNRFGIILK